MRAFAHVIAELNYGNWSAWFSDNPQVVSGGDDWECAVAILIDVHGSPFLEWKRIVAIEEMTWEGHAEFLIPYVNCSRYPVAASVN